MRLDERLRLLHSYDVAYRYEGKPLVSDKEYDDFKDALLRDLPKDHPLHTQVGLTPTERMCELPIPMYSMNKIKLYADFLRWVKKVAKSLGITIEEALELDVILTPKYDGISMVVNENVKKIAWTRGDGIIGQAASLHYKATSTDSTIIAMYYTVGEIIMKRETFLAKYLGEYSNGRNLVAGKFNSSNPDYSVLPDCEYMRYGLVQQDIILDYTKEEELIECNTHNNIKVPYVRCKLKHVDVTYTSELYDEWSADFEIDGVVLDFNDTTIRKRLGRETNNNPAYARALKFDFEETGYSKLRGYQFNVSKDYEIYPVGLLNPIDLEGSIVSKASMYNMARLKELGLVKESEDSNGNLNLEVGLCDIDIIKSGAVIPKVVKVHTNTITSYVSLNRCPTCDSVLEWDDNGVHVVCTNAHCIGQKFKEALRFFEIIKLKGIGPGSLKLLFSLQKESISELLDIEFEDILSVKGLGTKFAQLYTKSVNDLRTTGLPLHTAMHASNKFKNLGSKKLKLIIDDISNIYETTYLELEDINGIGAENADAYINGIPEFLEWLSETGIKTYIEEAEVASSTEMSHLVVAFSGIRDKELQANLTDKGAKVTSTINDNTTHLIVKNPKATTAKIKKARELGVVIITLGDFKKLM